MKIIHSSLLWCRIFRWRLPTIYLHNTFRFEKQGKKPSFRGFYITYFSWQICCSWPVSLTCKFKCNLHELSLQIHRNKISLSNINRSILWFWTSLKLSLELFFPFLGALKMSINLNSLKQSKKFMYFND